MNTTKNNTESLWQLPHMNIVDEVSAYINPYINTDPDFDPYKDAEDNNTVFISFSGVMAYVGLQEQADFGIASHYLNYPCNLHYHDYIEMIYIPKGKLLNVIEHVPFVMEAGSLCCINAGTSHFVTNFPKETEIPLVINLLLHPHLFEKISSIHDAQPLQKLFSDSPYLLFQKAELEPITPALNRLIHEYYQGGYELTYLALGTLLIFFDRLINHHLDNAIVHDDLTEKCLELIKNQPCRTNMETLCRDLGYSKGYLSRHIKQKTNKTISEHLMEEKLILAEKYLSETDLTIETIADLIGYQSESHFYRIFKNKFALTPKEYRKLIK